MQKGGLCGRFKVSGRKSGRIQIKAGTAFHTITSINVHYLVIIGKKEHLTFFRKYVKLPFYSLEIKWTMDALIKNFYYE